MGTSVIILGRQFGAPLGRSFRTLFYNPYAAKIGVWIRWFGMRAQDKDDTWNIFQNKICVRQPKFFLTTLKFFYFKFFSQTQLKIFYTKMRHFGEFLVNESRARGLLSNPRQGFNRLVQSCPIVCINDYHNSRRLRHGTGLQVLPFDIGTMYLWSCLSQK